MYASDYPHPECRFPGSVDHVLGWPRVLPETTSSPIGVVPLDRDRDLKQKRIHRGEIVKKFGNSPIAGLTIHHKGS
jgi:hypothetical protein